MRRYYLYVTVSIPQAVGTVATIMKKLVEVILSAVVSIPQAVSTVTSSPLFSLPFGQGLEMCGPHRRFTPLLPRTLHRIPQAVSTVATYTRQSSKAQYLCVSIPQAVGTVTTTLALVKTLLSGLKFQYRKR